MGKLSNALRKHFETTPQDTLDKEWEELSFLDNIGPNVKEYCEVL